MRTLMLAGLLLASPFAFAAMQTREVTWTLEDIEYQGFVVYDDAGGKRPGLVMVPNWMGVNPDQVEMAQQIAGDDYVVLVADVYGKDVRPQNPNEASAAAKNARADPRGLRARARKAVAVLKEQAGKAPLDTTKIGAIGFCFGGSTVLELARDGAGISGVASFHGGLATTLPAESGKVRAGVLVLNGAADAGVEAGQIQAFEQEMDAAGVDWVFVNFADAVHCFTEPTANRPPNCVYHERSARRAFAMMDDFFAEVFARESAADGP
ncbi:MAG TPA: dienelactone hydrolase family protein [Xanthomonadaceae bacterium]|nr:dienelactone hydrolase family protein [Xanthomonadaceae bacterium]